MDKIRWGIIGTGDVADRKGGPALYKADRSELAGITNRTMASAESFASRHGATIHTSVESLLADRDIDAVYIATPPNSHKQLTLQAATAGKHVLCEKPMANSLADCEEMIRVCQQQNVSLAIAHYRRYFPVVRKMKLLLDAGAVGKPLHVSATAISPFPLHVQEPWRLNQSVGGGGIVMDIGTHRFDLMAYFFGAAKHVSSVFGTQTLETTVEDAASVAIEFENGVQGSAVLDWNCPVERDQLEIVGTLGILSTDTLSTVGRLSLETTAGTEKWELPACNPVHLHLVQHFVDHLLDGQPNPLPGESGIMATAMALEVYRAG